MTYEVQVFKGGPRAALQRTGLHLSHARELARAARGQGFTARVKAEGADYAEVFGPRGTRRGRASGERKLRFREAA